MWPWQRPSAAVPSEALADLKPQYEVWCLIPNQRRWQRWGSVFQPLAQANANYSNFYLKLKARAANIKQVTVELLPES